MKSGNDRGKRRAVAIKYTRDLPAPLVIARGFGYIADAIVDSARSAEVPIIENEELSGQLVTIDAGKQIPESAYEVVAELLAFVYSINTTEGVL
jgi:flagellar biosynthesis protein